jgi:hypothetical protein
MRSPWGELCPLGVKLYPGGEGPLILNYPNLVSATVVWHFFKRKYVRSG